MRGRRWKKAGILAVIFSLVCCCHVWAAPKEENGMVLPQVNEEFRFAQTEEAPLVLLKKGTVIREEKSGGARAVGEAKKKVKAYVLQDEGDAWVYVESGRARGFVKRKRLIEGEKAQTLCKKKGKTGFMEAVALVPLWENQAAAYTRTTVRKTVVKKQYAVAKKTTRIYESQERKNNRTVGKLEKGALAYVLADGNQEVMYVESGDVRGFVVKSEFLTGREAQEAVEAKGESQFLLAEQIIAPQENAACYYTMTSTVEAGNTEAKRKELVKFALQFVGNPYVWGGTSLTDGADCSGFVQSIYHYFGRSLPRTAAEQMGCGAQIPVSEAKKGDLIFYSKNEEIYHVSIYIGNGQVVHAANSESGIKTSGFWGEEICAVNLLD